MATLSPFTGEPEQYGDRTSAELSPVRPSPERNIPLAPLAGLLPAPGTQLAPLATAAAAPIEPGPGGAQMVPRIPERPDLVAQTRQASQDYEQIGRAKSAVNAALINADVGIANEPDEKKRAKLIADRQQLGQAQALAAQSQQAAGEAVEMNIAKAGEELAVKQADETLSAMEETDAAIDEGQAKRDRRLAEQAASLDAAKRDQEESRARYTATLERGPRAAAVGSTFADIISETFSAALEQRVPNYAAVTKAAWDRDRALFQEDVSRAAGAMATSGDRVRDMGAETDNIIAEEATAQAAVIDAVTRKAELAVQRARTPLEKAKAGAVYKGMQEQRDAARANAAQARIDAQRKADKHRLDMQLGAAKIGKLGADTAKAEAAAAKLGRRGRGKRKTPSLLNPELAGFSAKDKSDIKAKGIRDPMSGKWLADERGVPVTASSSKVKEELEGMGIAAKGVIDKLNAIKAIKSNYGAGDWASLGAAGQSKAKQALSSWGAQVMTGLNRSLKLGALDSGTLDVFEVMLGDPAGLWDNTQKLDTVIQGMEAGFNDELRGRTGRTEAVNFPRFEVVSRTRADVERDSSQPYNPVTGGIRPSKERLELLEEWRQKAAQETGSLRAATEAAADRVVDAINDEHRTLMARMGADRKAARADGDTAKVKRITASMREQAKFASEANDVAVTQLEKVDEEEKREATAGRSERAAASEAAKAYNRGDIPSGAARGAF